MAYIPIEPHEVESGSPLTTELFQKIQQNIADINERIELIEQKRSPKVALTGYSSGMVLGSEYEPFFFDGEMVIVTNNQYDNVKDRVYAYECEKCDGSKKRLWIKAEFVEIGAGILESTRKAPKLEDRRTLIID